MIMAQNTSESKITELLESCPNCFGLCTGGGGRETGA